LHLLYDNINFTSKVPFFIKTKMTHSCHVGCVTINKIEMSGKDDKSGVDRTLTELQTKLIYAIDSPLTGDGRLNLRGRRER